MKIINGLCEVELKKIPANSIDLILTSPPYADRRKNTYGGISEEKYIAWFADIAKEIHRILKPTGSFFLNIKEHSRKGERSLYVYELVIFLKKEIGFNFIDTFAWTRQGYPGNYVGRFKNAWEPVFHFTKGKISDITFNPYEFATPLKEESIKRATRKKSEKTKNNSGMGGGGSITQNMINKGTTSRPSNVVKVFNVTNQFSAKAYHPAVFPVGLAEFFIGSFSNPGDLILDPFAGSGTVGVACENLGRDYILIEKESDYIDLIISETTNAALLNLI